MILVTSNQMRQFDMHTIDSLQVPGIVLMEHAGKAVAEAVLQHGARRVCVLCGKGNNGGDGWIAARWLRHKGVDVAACSVGRSDELTGDAQQAYQMAMKAGVPSVMAMSNPSDKSGIILPDADVYVDALLGTGSQRPLQGLLKQVVDAVNSRDAWVVAVDIPTGVDGSSGEVRGSAIQANVTVCMGMQKLGTAVSPGCYYAGEVRLADIGIASADGVTGGPLAETVDAAWVQARWPKRHSSAHKGSFGKLGIAVGSMVGAPVLAGLGAARSGVGLVVLAVPQWLSERLNAPLEFVLRPVSGQDVSGDDASRDLVLGAGHPFADCDAIVVGPGLGTEGTVWRDTFRLWGKVGVVDADGLIIALEHGPLGKNWVLTPHPKECARLLGWTTEDVQNQRVKAAQTLASQTQSTVVLKGFHTVIATPDEPLLVNLSGNEALATAGTGDVLAGVIGSFLAQGFPPHQAAAMGAWLHGRAGELAGRQLSAASVLASDVVENISRAIRLHFDN